MNRLAPQGTQVRRVKMARASGTPVSAMWLKRAVQGSMGSSSSRFLAALGLNLRYDQDLGTPLPAAWIELQSSPTFARAIVECSANGAAALSQDKKAAMIYGEMMASWSLSEDVTAQSILAARQDVHMMLKRTPPPHSYIVRTAQHCLKQVAKFTNNEMISREDMISYLAVPAAFLHRNEYPMQKYMWFAHRLNVFPWALVTQTANLTAVIPQFNDLNNVDYHELVEADLMVAEAGAVEAVWTTLSETQILGFYEAYYHANYDQRRRDMIAACFVLIASLTKGTNATEDWIDDRLARIEQLTGGLSLTGSVNSEVLINFGQLYPHSTMSVRQIYLILSTLYTWCDEDDLGPFKWMIEQAATSNITLAIGFADMVCKSAFNPVDYLLKIFGESQFISLATLIMHVLRNRFCSILSPPVEMKSYADLAYLAQYLEFKRVRGAGSKYAGNPIAYCTKPENELKAIADGITNIGSDVYSSDLQVEELFRTMNIDGEYMTQASGTYEVTGLLAVPNPFVDEHLRAAFERQQEGLRKFHESKLPSALRDIGVTITRVSKQEQVKKLNETQSQMGRDITLLLNALRSACLQQKLAIVPDTRNIALSYESTLPENTLDALRRLGVQIPDEYTVAPVEVADRRVLNINNLTDISVLSRGLVDPGVPPAAAIV